jgi:hypothetical protein
MWEPLFLRLPSALALNDERNQHMYKAPEVFNGQDLDVSPFDTPAAKASTALVAALSVAMAKQVQEDLAKPVLVQKPSNQENERRLG